MKITQYLHTAILVSNLEKAEYFYGQILGLAKVDRVLNYPGVWYQLGNYQIHLIVHPNFAATLTNEEKLGRNPHIAFAVDNLNEAIKKLESSGYFVEKSRSGRAAFFTQDSDGNVIEISQV